MRHLIVFLLLLPGYYLSAQQDPPHYIDISRISLAESIAGSASTLFTDNHGALVKDGHELGRMLEGKSFTPGLIHKGIIPPNRVTSTLFLKFHITNSADSTVSVYFFPGLYYKEIRLYTLSGSSYEKLPGLLPSRPDSIGFRQLSLDGGDTATIVAELHFVRTYINTTNPRLIHPAFLPAFISSMGNRNLENDTMTYIFCGLLLMMIFFSLANYLQGANPEFLYYSGYAFFLGSMLFTKAVFNFHSSQLSFFLEGYLDFVLQGTGILFYMIFMQRFLETRVKYPFLFKLYRIGIIVLLASMLSYTFFFYVADNFQVVNSIENATKVLLLIMVIIFLVFSLRQWNDRLLRYLFWGNLCLFIFSLMSQFIIMNPALRNLPGIFGSALFYYEIGLLLELVFFLAGLNHKNRRKIISQTSEREALKAQNRLKEYEKELAVYKAQQEERERISADMHDELGSGMTAIRLMSEIAKNKMKENTPVEIDRISASADDVLNKMNAIIWSMHSENDTLDNLVSYIRSYALEYFENTSLECRVIMPDEIPDREITGDKRRNIFLCIKETLNNALKHSRASQVIITIELNHRLKITVQDNGVGMDPANLREFGNGLKNIRKRMQSIGGQVEIINDPGVKTVLQLEL